MKATIGDPPIKTADQFHTQVAKAMAFPHYYGKNLDALWDVLQSDIERPTELTWLNSKLSSEAMRGDFAKIVEVCRAMTDEDTKNGVPAFKLVLE